MSSRASRASIKGRTEIGAPGEEDALFLFRRFHPSAMARCVLPVPIGPAKIRFSGAVTYAARASVWICVALMPAPCFMR